MAFNEQDVPTPVYYPAFLNLTGKRCVVVGGGQVAERKTARLLASGARVCMISPTLTAALQAMVDTMQMTWVARAYETGDLVGAFLVVAATNRPEVNRAVLEDAKAACQLINVVDAGVLGSFIVPASVEQGDVHVAISTSGIDPRRAQQLRKYLEADLVQGTNHFVQMLREFLGS